MKKIKNNENRKLCGECNGRCCRHHSCETSPIDVFGNEPPTIEKLLNFLSSGKYQIDWWDGDVRGLDYDNDDYRHESYYIRPAHTNTMGKLFDPAYTGTCVFFIDGKGCELNFEHRPYGGKALVPSEKGCHSSFSKKEACLAWSEFYNMFVEIIVKYDYEYINNKFVFTKRTEKLA